MVKLSITKSQEAIILCRTYLIRARPRVVIVIYSLGSNLSAPEETTAYVTTNHAFLSHQILDIISPPKPMIIQNSENTKALHLHVGGDEGLSEANGVFSRLSKERV